MGENGWLTRRLNYIKVCKKNLADATELAEQSLNESTESLDNAKRDLEWLKTNLIRKSDRNDLIKKLNSTRELRKEMLKATETDLREQFPFFFAEPELVSVSIVRFQTHYSFHSFGFSSYCGTIVNFSKTLHHQMHLSIIGQNIKQRFVSIVMYLSI